MRGAAEEREGKLHFKGTTNTQAEANKIWDAIKTIPTWQTDVVADIKATGAKQDSTRSGARAAAVGEEIERMQVSR